MKASMKKKRGVVGAVVLAGILSVGGYALTNTITFEEARSQAGFGAQEITNVQVTDIDYTLGTNTAGSPNVASADMEEVTNIRFHISPAVLSGDDDAEAWMEYTGKTGATWVACGAITDAAIFVDCPPPANTSIQDIGEDSTGRTAFVPGAAGQVGTPGTQGTQGPLRLVIAE